MAGADAAGSARNSGISAAVYTIGHGARTLRAFLDLLGEARIVCIVDVRARPYSRRHPHFSRSALASGLAEAGIDYRWEGGDLGGFREPGADSRNVGLSDTATRGFADQMGTEPFRAAAGRVLALASRMPVAIMCAESDPRQCHRRLISDWCVLTGSRVLHLIAPGRVETHLPEPGVRIEGNMPVYGVQGVLPF